MLTHLQIRDLAIIDAVELDFVPGLTVLTGETGAGKSIIVDALMLVGGARATADQIRAGAERTEVAATFDISAAPKELRDLLEEQSIEAEDELLVRRVIGLDGRSRAYLNGRPCRCSSCGTQWACCWTCMTARVPAAARGSARAA
jgi:DNA repair protein RecN (Recombination protein N)